MIRMFLSCFEPFQSISSRRLHLLYYIYDVYWLYTFSWDRLMANMFTSNVITRIPLRTLSLPRQTTRRIPSQVNWWLIWSWWIVGELFHKKIEKQNMDDTYLLYKILLILLLWYTLSALSAGSRVHKMFRHGWGCFVHRGVSWHHLFFCFLSTRGGAP